MVPATKSAKKISAAQVSCTEIPIQCERSDFPSPGLRPPSPHRMGRGQAEGRCCFQLRRRHCKEASGTAH